MRARAATVLLALAVAGCHVSVGGTSVSADQVEKKVSAELAKTVGQTPKSVDCPDDLEGKVGTKLRCTLTADDGTVYGLTVTVTTVKGSDVHFDVKVDDAPESTPSPTS